MMARMSVGGCGHCRVRMGWKSGNSRRSWSLFWRELYMKMWAGSALIFVKCCPNEHMKTSLVEALAMAASTRLTSALSRPPSYRLSSSRYPPPPRHTSLAVVDVRESTSSGTASIAELVRDPDSIIFWQCRLLVFDRVACVLTIGSGTTYWSSKSLTRSKWPLSTACREGWWERKALCEWPHRDS
ncbi:uncharacterized protein LAESUDRAFT_79175 [Laetiporus sulphureus 93-53]|uniref:Uncharacterized protein n=1 Tax=Laetiporus sulphureus 93-53 TaxID=1314785 RepID=A0A165F1H8_9APHY|nr:uncharacterized protein LAESUDRAFT_79175 [Laetiporus sulphureus 93-53]KZT08174.1 hypothetical protein LAESUDRAFT_79175 [Laetiporus sulphureus 93-53]